MVGIFALSTPLVIFELGLPEGGTSRPSTPRGRKGEAVVLTTTFAVVVVVLLPKTKMTLLSALVVPPLLFNGIVGLAKGPDPSESLSLAGSRASRALKLVSLLLGGLRNALWIIST